MSAPIAIFLPSGKRGTVKKGTTVLSAARELNVDLDSVCGGRGSMRCSQRWGDSRGQRRGTGAAGASAGATAAAVARLDLAN